VVAVAPYHTAAADDAVDRLRETDGQALASAREGDGAARLDDQMTWSRCTLHCRTRNARPEARPSASRTAGNTPASRREGRPAAARRVTWAGAWAGCGPRLRCGNRRRPGKGLRPAPRRRPPQVGNVNAPWRERGTILIGQIIYHSSFHCNPSSDADVGVPHEGWGRPQSRSQWPAPRRAFAPGAPSGCP
jgi:hypothetical protein